MGNRIINKEDVNKEGVENMQISMEAVQSLVEIFLPAVAIIVTLVKFLYKLYKCVTIENIDKVFLSKEKQWFIALGQRMLGILWYSIAFFAISFCIPNEKIPLRREIYAGFVLMFVAVVIKVYVIIAQTNKKVQSTLKKQGWVIAIFLVYYVALLISGMIIERIIYIMYPDIRFLGRIVLSIIFSACCFEFLLSIEEIMLSTKVWIKHEQYGKLVLLYAVDKNTILCTVDGEKEIYVRVLKEELTNVKIHIETEKSQ